MNLSELTVPTLLKLQAAAVDELRSRGVVRTANNPTGDFAEWLVATAFDWSLATNSAAGYDAISADGRRIQIKARRVTSRNRSRQLGVIRNLVKRDFDELVAVIFDESFGIIEAVSVPHEVVGEYAVYREHVNGHVLQARGALLKDSRVRNIRGELLQVLAQ